MKRHIRRPDQRRFADQMFIQFPTRSEHALYAHMFTEDITLGLMPINFSDGRKFGATLTGAVEQVERARKLLQSIGRGGGYRDNVLEEADSSIEHVVRHMAANGRAVFEIATDPNDNGYILLDVPDFGLFKMPRGWVQTVPLRGRREGQPTKRSWRFVSDRWVWAVSMPGALGGRSGYRRIVRHLRGETELVPRFFNLETEARQRKTPFDFGSYRRTREILHNQITVLWGWNRRDSTTNYTTDYYHVYKALTMLWAQGVLRQHVVLALNELFAKLEIESKLELSGIEAPDVFLAARNSLEKGEMPFKDAVDLTTAMF